MTNEEKNKTVIEIRGLIQYVTNGIVNSTTDNSTRKQMIKACDTIYNNLWYLDQPINQ